MLGLPIQASSDVPAALTPSLFSIEPRREALLETLRDALWSEVLSFTSIETPFQLQLVVPPLAVLMWA